MPLMGVGPSPARIMLVGEAFGEEEERRGEPFVGSSGLELNRMLHEAGIMRSECYVTNVVNARPKDNDIGTWIAAKKKDITSKHQEFRGRWVMQPIVDGVARLEREIALVQPNVIVAFGNTPLWALTGATAITKWRGSQLSTQFGDVRPKLIPTIHPAAVLRQWENRVAVVHDLRRAAREVSSKEYANVPQWSFTIRPSYPQVVSWLDSLDAHLDSSLSPVWVDWDYEIRAGHIACCGLSRSLTDAICIPFMCTENHDGYWSDTEEAEIVYRLYKTLTHPNIRVRGQNLLYDAQYSYRHWHFVPRVAQDTMISWHTMYAGLPKRLDYQASMLCDHYVYWKDEGRTWFKGED